MFIVKNNWKIPMIQTPIHKINSNQNNLYIKREDFIPFSFGGNKARKSIYFFNEIEKGNYDCVVTYGSSSSNHCRIISNICALKNIQCYIVSPKEVSHPTYNSKFMDLFQAKIIVVPVEEVHDTLENLNLDLKIQGKSPYFIPGGGHGNLGTQAYVDCYSEILDFEKQNNISFDYIFHASGTGTTQAGLVCGHLINNDNKKIIGISIARKNPRGKNVILDSICDYLEEKNYKFNPEIIDKDTNFIDDYIIEGYGKNSLDLKNIVKEMLINYGIPLDFTYTGKAFLGMNEYIKDKSINGKNILFIHTGGTPLFFDNINEL